MRIVLVVLILVLAASARADEDFTLRTEDTILVVRHWGDRVGVVQFGPVDSSWNWIGDVAYFEPALPRVVDGQRQPIAWRLTDVRSSRDDAGETVTARFSADSPRLEMRVAWTARPGPGPIEQTLAVVNRSSDDVALGAMPSLAWRMQPAPGAALEHRWVEKGAGTPPKVGVHATPIGKGFRHRGISSPRANKRDSGEAIPWQCVHDAAGGHGWYTGIASSAHVAQQVDATDAGALDVSLGFDENVAPLVTVVRGGGRVAFPPVLLGCYRGGIDDGCNRFHRWGQRWMLPPSDDERLPLLTNNSWGGQLDVDEARCRRMIDAAAALGFEMFHVDAGWYRDVGDWRADPRKFPRGMRPVSDHAHEKGLKFGLWVAWTQGGHVVDGPDVLSVFAPGMRDWFPADAPAGWTAQPWRGDTVCLGSPAARRWCLERLRRLVREYNLDLLEHDQPIIVTQCARRDHDHTSSPVDVGRGAAEGYYEIHDALRREFPDLLFENCVNGGCTVDFGIMRRCHFVSATDSYDPMSNRKAFFDASFPLPPRAIEAYVAEYPRATLDNFAYMLRSGMLGWCSIMIDTTAWNPEERRVARRQLEIYKTHLRPLIRQGNLHHVSPRPRDRGWDAFQYHDPRRGAGVVLAFRAKSPSARETFRLQGLEPDAVYALRFEDHGVPTRVATGRALVEDGLTVDLPSEESSQIVYLQRR
ncbi:MAG: alpha-galactosidase [Pirellulales bacterium]|nr:alpha-galactosidase [Pirellulales bacterium]